MSNNLGNLQGNGAAHSLGACWASAFLQPAPQVVLIQAGARHPGLPLCADSIRNNCILASLHSSPLHHHGLTLYCISVLQEVTVWTEGERKDTAAYYLFFNIHIPLDWMESCTEPPLIWKSISLQHLALTTTIVVFICTEQHFWAYPHFLLRCWKCTQLAHMLQDTMTATNNYFQYQIICRSFPWLIN